MKMANLELELDLEYYDVRVEPPKRYGANPRCPHCESIIYSRRSPICGVCARPLPDVLLFSPTESRRVTQLLQTEKQRHRAWMSKSFNRGLSCTC